MPGAHPPGPRRQGRPAGPGGGDRGGPRRQRASRTRTSPSRARATASAAPTPSGARIEAGCRSSARSSGSSRPTSSSRSRCPASTPGPPAAPGPAFGVTEASTRDLMELSPIELVLGLFVVAVALAYVARRIGVAYPILLVLGGLALGLRPRPADDRARPERRLPAPPAADPVRRRLLHADPRLQGEPPADRAARGRARAVHDGRRRRRRPAPGPGAGGRRRRVRARGDRRAAGRGRGDGDLPAPRRSRAGS